MLKMMSSGPRLLIPGGGRNAEVISRYHWPVATPASGPPAVYRPRPSISMSLASPGRIHSTRYSTMLMPTSVQVTTARRLPGRPPNTPLGRRAPC